jgi:hypothetical protein
VGYELRWFLGCRAQATVRVWDNGRKWNELYDASRKSVCEGSTFSPAPSSARLQPGGGLQLGGLFQVCQAGQLRRYKGSATVLRGKGKVGVFQEEVSEDDQFAPEDGEGEFFGFAVGEEAQVEGFPIPGTLRAGGFGPQQQGGASGVCETGANENSVTGGL